MEQGNLLKEKSEYIKERFNTIEGLSDFFFGSAIWAYAIINYQEPIFNYLLEATKNFSTVGFQPPFTLQYYLSYLLLALIFTAIGLVITRVIVYVVQKMRKLL